MLTFYHNHNGEKIPYDETVISKNISIEDNMNFGNYFIKHWAELMPGRVFHAHNSYLQTFANMGILIGVSIIIFILKKIKKSNYLYVIPILVYSGFQYGILWGISFLNIIFFYFLFNVKPISNKSIQEYKSIETTK